MCGIFGYLGKPTSETELFDAYNNSKHRGPDRSEFHQTDAFTNTYVGFHRLAIMDLSSYADQPFYHDDEESRIYVGCNGEIYNYKTLIKEHDLKPNSTSDCEVIIHLYVKYGVKKMLELIKGEYALFIFDYRKKKNEMDVYLARDQCGIRPMYFGYSEESFAFCSEIKGLTASIDKPGVKQLVPNIQHFPPRQYMTMRCMMVEGKLKMERKFDTYIDYTKIPFTLTNKEDALKAVRESLTRTSLARINSDREYGTLLSGGLDSSLTSAIVAKELEKKGKKLKTFSIGMPGATDREYAELVAKHIGSVHTHIEMSEADFLAEIENIVSITETYDITTIRATTGNYLVAKWVAQNTDIKVLIIGDGSDELCSGYLYFHNAPTPEESHNENLRLLTNLHLYDCLRADRSIANNGIEARVPFLDLDFIETYLSIDPKLRVPTVNHKGVRIEKYLLREAFNGTGLLPDEVLWRKKEAFSDGVSGEKRSWYTMIQEKAEKIYSDEEFKKATEEYKHLPPTSKEALYFRRIFERIFGKGDVQNVVPAYWLPLWCGDMKDPSARLLNAYDEDSRKE